DESSLKEKQPALIGHTAGHYQPPDLTQSKAYSSSVNIAVNMLPRRNNMAPYSVHLNREIATASSQAARNDVQHWAAV
ncbi:hypothetical protein X801_08635, partial [Opisthorchis viverrini]